MAHVFSYVGPRRVETLFPRRFAAAAFGFVTLSGMLHLLRKLDDNSDAFQLFIDLVGVKAQLIRQEYLFLKTAFFGFRRVSI